MKAKDQQLSHAERLSRFDTQMLIAIREKGRDPTQLIDKSPNTNGNSKKQSNNTKTPPKPSITQPLRTDLGRSLGVTRVTQLV